MANARDLISEAKLRLAEVEQRLRLLQQEMDLLDGEHRQLYAMLLAVSDNNEKGGRPAAPTQPATF
jgi:ABC-type uncharacterized transport system ATPase component